MVRSCVGDPPVLGGRSSYAPRKATHICISVSQEYIEIRFSYSYIEYIHAFRFMNVKKLLNTSAMRSVLMKCFAVSSKVFLASFAAVELFDDLCSSSSHHRMEKA